MYSLFISGIIPEVVSCFVKILVKEIALSICLSGRNVLVIKSYFIHMAVCVNYALYMYFCH